jgi:hypothetical protein
MSRKGARAAGLLRGLCLALLVLCALEGAASWFGFGYDLVRNARPALAERAHTEYDPELGWVSRCNERAADLYGPGRGLSTNARGFRGTRETELDRPSGRLRVLCSGDSFTLGYGVGDADTWPAQLERLAPQAECVNLGQGGYGIDQSGLWFLRAGAPLEHDWHLFAFIADDFERMRSDDFQGYGRPLLALDGQQLRIANAPVSQRGLRWPWLTQNRELFESLRLVQLAQRGFAKLGAGQGPLARDVRVLEPEQARAIASALFAQLEQRARESGARLVLVHLPARDRAAPGGFMRLSGWARAALDEARARGTRCIDLHSDFERLAALELDALYIAHGELDYPGAAGHYSAAGNAFAAQALLRALRAVDPAWPQVADAR